MHATRDADYLLDERYADDGSAVDRDLVDEARALAERARRAAEDEPSWQAFVNALHRLGADEARPTGHGGRRAVNDYAPNPTALIDELLDEASFTTVPKGHRRSAGPSWPLRDTAP